MVLAAALTAMVAMAGIARSATLSSVVERGHLICGTSKNETGFSWAREDGRWQGLYVDLCRAIAAAVLGHGDAVRFRALAGTARFQAVRDGEVDVLARGTAWTLTRDAQQGLRFVGAFFHGGTGFLIAKSSGITSALELSGATVCFVSGGLTQAAVRSFFARREMKFTPLTAETWSGVAERYASGQCTVIAADGAQLALARRKFREPGDHVLLPETFSFETFGPLVRSDDAQWFSVVRWVIFALIRAEELDLDSKSIAAAARSDDPAVRGFLEAAAAASRSLGLAQNWLKNVIENTGSYATIYDRNLGPGSGVGLQRGRNALVSNGGAMFAPAFR